VAANYVAVSVSDANQASVPGYTISIVDPSSLLKTSLLPVGSETSGTGKTYQIFDIVNLKKLGITVAHPQYAGRSLEITLDSNTGNWSTNARSVYFGIYSPSTITSSIVPTVEIPLLRVRRSQTRRLAVPGPTGTAEGVLDDPGAIWLNPSGQVVGLTDGSISGYPVVVDPTLSKDETKSDWGRFNSASKGVDPSTATGGTWFDWLEYGDPGTTKWLMAIWVIGRAGAKPNPNTTDVVVLYSPNTAFSLYAPKDVYPYKRKFILNKLTNNLVLVQPYPNLAYRYLAPGGTSGKDGKDFGFAYQAMAAERSLVLIMPIQFFGFWGPVLAQDGLARMIQEVLLYVGDNTVNATQPFSVFGQYQRPRLGRIALAGYSAGMSDVRLLLKTSTYQALASTYAALASKATGADRANYSDMAQRLRALPESMWASPADLFTKNCREVYSIDGFFQGDNKSFQNEMGDWFTRTDDAMLRIYATDGRFKESEVITGTKLDDVFRGVSPQVMGKPPLASKEFHRSDARASFAWFTEAFMTFKGVDFMPDATNPDIDAHHTIPRVVLSHAISLSRFAKP